MQLFSKCIKQLKRLSLKKVVRIGIPVLMAVLIAFSALYIALLPDYTVKAVDRSYQYSGEKTIQNFEFDTKTGDFSVTLTNNTVWKSNLSPEAAEADTTAKGANRMSMRSQLLISYTDKKAKISQASSYVNALNKGETDLKAVVDQNKVTCTYRFQTGKKADNLFIEVPVEYAFYNDYFDITIKAEDIKENDSYRLVDITVLPYLASTDQQAKGYMLMPDGSGSVIYLNNGKFAAQNYSAFIYGRDGILKNKIQIKSEQTARLPVFGVSTENAGMLALITKGASLASVEAYVSGMISDYNTAYFTFKLREKDTITLSEMSWDERNLDYVSNTRVKDDLQIRYFLTTKQAPTFTDFAKIHRAYLQSETSQKEARKPDNTPELYCDIQMSVERIEPFFGLPKSTLTPLTTVSQLEEMTASLVENGITDIRYHLSGYQDGGRYAKVPTKLDFDSKLGSKKAFVAFGSRFADKNIGVYFATDFVNAQKSGNGFVPVLHAQKDVTGALNTKSVMLQSTGVKDLTKPSSYLINPYYSYSLLQRFIKNNQLAEEKNLIKGLSTDEYASNVYSDVYASAFDGISNRSSVTRNKAEDVFYAGMTEAKAQFGSLMTSSANQYAIDLSDVIANTPFESSEYRICDKTVPYYQAVLSGYKKYTSPYVNLDKDSDAILLQSIATGALPYYTLTYEESSYVKNTKQNDFYNGQFSQWESFIVENYKKYKEVYTEILGQSMTAYEEPVKGVTKTVFENGCTVYTNQTDKDQTIDDRKLASMSYQIVKGGNGLA